MDIPFIKGIVSKQAHVGVPDGTYEEEYARDGFFGKYAHLYRTQPLTNWESISGPLKPRAFDPVKAIGRATDFDYFASRKTFLENADVKVQMFLMNQSMPYYFRNADADEVHFIHQGEGEMETDFGVLRYEKGDYLVIPRGTIYRIHPKAETQTLLIESMSEIRFPEKGILGQHALVDPAMIRTPTPHSQLADVNGTEGRYELKIKRCNQLTTVTYGFKPVNVVGWKGTLTVMQLNVRDIRPVLSDRYHLPPTAHITFVAGNFVICTFLPRPLENGDPTAMKVPFQHLNIDYDEVLFYHQGQFFSRTGINEGMITFHPQGIEHGPQKGAVDRAKDAKRTDEIAVMIDTKNPLFMTEGAESVESNDYWKSWR
jgi:homogentisate 1,2-dioxygenase